MTDLVEASRRALAAVQLARKEKFLSPLRSQMRRVMGVHFSQQRAALDHALRDRERHLNEARVQEGLVDDIGGILDDIFATYRDGTSSAMRTVITRGMEGAITHRIADFGYQVNFDLENPVAQKSLLKYCADKVTQIDETTRMSVKGIIARGEREGTSYTDIAKQLLDKFEQFGTPAAQEHIKNRAELIAVTELGEAYESASRQTVDHLSAKGLPMVKSWLTAGDDRVSEECAANEDEGWIPVDQPHQSGHQHPLRFPGCRCCELYELDENAAG